VGEREKERKKGETEKRETGEGFPIACLPPNQGPIVANAIALQFAELNRGKKRKKKKKRGGSGGSIIPAAAFETQEMPSTRMPLCRAQSLPNRDRKEKRGKEKERIYAGFSKKQHTDSPAEFRADTHSRNLRRTERKGGRKRRGGEELQSWM